MNWRTFGKRASALALAAVLTAALPLPAAAAESGDGVAPTCDEAYYATLDYYGSLMEGSVVKSYAMNGKDRLTDYGVYDDVINLTDRTAPVRGEGATSFRFDGGAPDHFYFEGKTTRPFEDLPWTVSLHYTLNGVPARAEDLAGKQGVVEILLDLVPNENAGSYARYNYTLAATALFNQDDILSLEAPGAQVQLVGNLRTVLFLCLPGEEQHFTIRVGSDSFTFGGLTVLMAPATLAQLEEIAKLSQRKDDLEADYQALSGSLDHLLDALNDIQNGLYASAKGLDQLEAARSTFSGGKGVLYDGTDRLRGDLSNLADLLAPVEERILLLSQTVTESNAVLNEMADSALTLQAQLAELEEALYGLERGTYDLRNVVTLAADMESSLLRLERALGGTHVSSSVSTNSAAMVQKVKNVHGVYAMKDQDAFFAGMLALQGKNQGQIRDIQSLLGLDESTAAAIGKQQEWQAAQAAKKQMDGLHSMKENGMSFQDFCGQLGASDSEAKQMNDLWLIYNSGEVVGGKRQASPEKPRIPAPAETPETTPAEPPAETPAGNTAPEPSESPESPETPPSPEPPASEPAEPAEPEEAPSETEPLTAKLLLNAPNDEASGSEDSGGESSGSDSSSGNDSSGGSDSSGGNDDAGTTTPGGGDSDGDSSGGNTPGEDTPGGDTPSKPPENNTVGGAVVDLITSGLDSASARIDQIQNELNNTLNAIKAPTAAVAGDLANLCAGLNSLLGDLDSAEDLAAALRQSSGTLREILADAEALRTVLNGYEPTLQEALRNAGALSASASATIRDTETLLSDAENLARSTGKQLDAGTKQSLAGLSAALRQTAKALAATGEVRDAKNTITNIIEDTWNEYTGDVNNMLMMDATAETVSLTDSRNPAPSSVQVLIRTQEIQLTEAPADAEAAAGKPASTFWGRVGQMFRDFWNAVTGIFH
ncbi:hypothetical protein AALC17_02940 [Oscillospiraceae bacterium 38-13]